MDDFSQRKILLISNGGVLRVVGGRPGAEKGKKRGSTREKGAELKEYLGKEEWPERLAGKNT